LVGVPLADRAGFEAALDAAGFKVAFAPTPPSEGLATLTYSMFVLDLRGDFDAMLAIEQLHLGAPDAAIVALVPNGELALAVSAMKMGARLCLSLPVKRDRLLATARSLRQTLLLEDEVHRNFKHAIAFAVFTASTFHVK
jgi:ActR/RegA family two-component response regulator